MENILNFVRMQARNVIVEITKLLSSIILSSMEKKLIINLKKWAEQATVVNFYEKNGLY